MYRRLASASRGVGGSGRAPFRGLRFPVREVTFEQCLMQYSKAHSPSVLLMDHGTGPMRRVFTAGLTALVIAALSHCSWEDGRELARRMAAVGAQPLVLPSPIQQPAHDCAHESGCICRGVTLVHAVTAAHLKPAASSNLSAAVDAVPRKDAAELAASAETGRWARHCVAPPLSGRQLRARYASLVI
jgi:hypothetical protein